MDNVILKQFIELTTFSVDITEQQEKKKEEELVRQFRIKTLSLHFRGIPFIVDMLKLRDNDYDYFVRNWSEKCEYIKSADGNIVSDKLIPFLNFAISDVSSFGEINLYLIPSDEEHLLISVSYQKDISLIFPKSSEIADKIAALEAKYPLLFT